MATLKVWKKPTIQVSLARLAASGSGPTNDKTSQHHS